MKNIHSILLITIIAITGCQKDKAIEPATKKSLPFESSNLKMEIISSTVPLAWDMHFLNETTGIIITRDGNIYKTIDKGTTWMLKYSNPVPDQPLNQIFFVDENVGYVVGGSSSCQTTGCTPPGGLLLKTTDGGDTWTTSFQMPGEFEFASLAVNSNGNLLLVVNGFSGPGQQEAQILKSNDGGITWTPITTLNFGLVKITFNNNFGFCTGGDGKITRSSDDGNTWNHTTTFDVIWTGDIAFSNDVGYCLADNHSVYKTIDNGDNWTETYVSSYYQTYKLNPLSDNSCLLWGSGPYTGGCFGGSNNGAINQTTNAGNIWISNEFEDISTIRLSSFYSTTTGYILAGGYGGRNLIKVTVE